jgi:serine/threonine protein kinase
VFLTTGQASNSEEKFVLKMFSVQSDFGYDDYEFARMDANVNEKLDGNPRIVSMYSYCGISIISEAMMQGDLENVAVSTGVGRPVNIPHDGPQLTVRNTLSGIQKLSLSLEMAEAVLLLHTFSGGVIVHDDIQLSQFLISPNGQLKLNDFNRAEIMLWNDKDQEYCKYRNHPGGGDVSFQKKYQYNADTRFSNSQETFHSIHSLSYTVAFTGRISRPSLG